MTSFLTPSEVAAELRVTARKVCAMCNRGELRAVWVSMSEDDPMRIDVWTPTKKRHR